ncbi:YdcH family protein [Altererythrobacter sp. H2]|uniref:YdcH family protein n=1 Tax=Altererythrobacter sp. H2 TaxID=3108391 RepID=UPI002B4BF4E0|nr:YdcH family protein [Altererythrobacter sp. H2]WRK96766.1 YdcH family protein [Altererythrobacter sp. H2]
MTGYLDRLVRRHRRLDRMIDTSKAVGKQEELKVLKRLRLRLKDRIEEIRQRNHPVTR